MKHGCIDKAFLDTLPDKPGVYLMKDASLTPLYIGKASSLKKRVAQYFTKKGEKRAKVLKALEKITHVDTIITPNEKEALILENILIKKHQPRYNSLLKDDKHYVSIALTTSHTYPSVLIKRMKGIAPKKDTYFGPFTSALVAKEMVSLLHKIYRLRQCSNQEMQRRQRPCILFDMKQCLAPCVNKCSEDEYALEVKKAIRFLKGDSKQACLFLDKQIERASKNLEFERAQLYLETKNRLKAYSDKHKAVVSTTIDPIDCLGFYAHSEGVVITKLMYREGKLSGMETLLIDNVLATGDDFWQSLLLSHYKKTPFLPSKVLLPVKVTNMGVVETILSETLNKKIAFSTPEKGQKKQMVVMANTNAKNAFDKHLDDYNSRAAILLSLQEKLNFSNYPHIIDCFDTSHFSGSSMVAGLVRFIGGERSKAGTRLFHLKNTKGGDDYGGITEAMNRHLIKAKASQTLPHLIIIDGGFAHARIAAKVLTELNIATIDVIGLAKDKGNHSKGILDEAIFFPDKTKPLMLEARSPLLFFIQRIRDETHQVAINFSKKTLKKKLISSSLEKLPGIGKKKQQDLLKKFKSPKVIKQATKKELESVTSLTKKDIETLLLYQQQP
ncbi:excinuclease ABC subunit C [Candidatus Aerophobetes bacterium]|uniref:UvrABC system protein C n=1 Tax=Aerophobetes bacterium TaxID=2030807 RepID=A0A2A4X8X7_UNCAE|nr:MAG: excinuclease ABC subunit C [Candidatus Aerophobetes bacterium]